VLNWFIKPEEALMLHNFHHAHYADDHLVSRTYLGDEGNITPYFLIPVFLVGGAAYFLLPLNLFVVMVIASAASFYAHVFSTRNTRRRVAASKVCVVQTPARTALRSSPSREQQFWCNSLFLGQDSRYLSKAECRRINQTPATRLRFSIASQFEFCLSSQIASASTESFLCRFT
jgi:hypothetical protein